jgi:hypothetical protein
MGFLNNISTGKDNKTHDIGRVAAIACIVVGLGLQIYAVGWKGQLFDMQAFGLGVGAMAAGIGAMLKLKERSEPDPKEDAS